MRSLNHYTKLFLIFFLSICLTTAEVGGAFVSPEQCYAKTNSNGILNTGLNLVVLSCYEKRIPIDGEFLLIAVTSNLKMPTFKSSNSSVASVDSYGLVTGKKAGTCKITAKVKGGEASCKVTVERSTLTISKTSASMENGAELKLTAKVSTGHDITWKSSSQAVCTVDEYGVVTAKKCGTAKITAKADGESATCKVTVKKPTVSLNKTEAELYRDQTLKLTAKSSNKSEIVWKSSKNSVAMVDDTGTVTAIAHGTARITATVDGVSKTCKVTVKQPTIKLSLSELKLSVGAKKKLKATVSSGADPEWYSSNDTVASVDSEGNVTARQKGKAYIYAKEDGAKASCIVQVAEK